MKLCHLAPIAWTLPLLLASCGGSPDTTDKISADLKAEIAAAGSALDSVHDEPSAKAAVPQLVAVKEHITALAERYQKLPNRTLETDVKLTQQADADTGELNSKMLHAVMNNPKAAEIVGPAFTDISEALARIHFTKMTVK